MSRLVVYAVICFMWSSPVLGQNSARGSAQTRIDSDWYGTGIHQYFRGQYDQAIASLSLAIAANPTDARPYYFRGLAKTRMFGDGNGNADFQQGAYVENRVSGVASSSVNRSLERIQGPCRLRIEQFRRNSRFARLQPASQPSLQYGGVIDVQSISPMIQGVLPSQIKPATSERPAPVEESSSDQDGKPTDSNGIAPGNPPQPDGDDDFPEQTKTVSYETAIGNQHSEPTKLSDGAPPYAEPPR